MSYVMSPFKGRRERSNQVSHSRRQNKNSDRDRDSKSSAHLVKVNLVHSVMKFSVSNFSALSQEI